MYSQYKFIDSWGGEENRKKYVSRIATINSLRVVHFTSKLHDFSLGVTSKKNHGEMMEKRYLLNNSTPSPPGI